MRIILPHLASLRSESLSGHQEERRLERQGGKHPQGEHQQERDGVGEVLRKRKGKKILGKEEKNTITSTVLRIAREEENKHSC